jgi:hypothetical protein
MHPLGQIVALATVIVGCAAAPLFAQWRDVRTKVPLTAAGTPNLEAPAPVTADGKTDLSGLWDAERMPCDETKARLGCIDAQTGIPPQAINIAPNLPMQPWAEALVKQRGADLGKDDTVARCLPIVSPRAWPSFAMQKIIQTADSLTILDEYMLQYRQIFLDGRTLPKDPEPSFKGYSVGKWDGDTLVVETSGYKDGQWLDIAGHPLTDQARTIERIRRVNYGTLQVELTVDDPKAYTKPWTTMFKLSLAINTDLLEYVCNENEKSLQHMVGPTAAK